MDFMELKKRYDAGENISSLLRELQGKTQNTDEIIELAYDLQSGTYIEGMKENEEISSLRWKYTGEIVDVIKRYCPHPKSFFKGGVGESVTLVPMLKQFDEEIKNIHGMDMCWSRLGVGRNWLQENDLNNVQLVMGTLSEIPFVNNAFDVVVTSHSMEPNGGREEEILAELYRVAGNYLFIAEPNYELASREGKERIDRLGYVKGIEETACKLGFDIVENKALSTSMNPLNPTSVLVIHKGENLAESPYYACPVSKKRLIKFDSCFFSDEQGTAYPIIEGIPCLRRNSSVIASKLPELSNRGVPQ